MFLRVFQPWLFAVLLSIGIGSQAWGAPSIKSIYSFSVGPANARAGLVAGPDGQYYGTSEWGGANGAGTIFQVTPAGALTVLVQFTGSSGAVKGANPRGTLLSDGAGTFYGVTAAGGATGLGTVYKIASGGAFTTLAEFTGVSGSTKGNQPTGGLAFDSAGNLYGTTSAGGASDLGTVFRISTAGVFSTLAEFTGTAGATPGSHPLGGLIGMAGSDGDLVMGTTSGGGATGFGTVFKVTAAGFLPATTTFTGPAGDARGSTPASALFADAGGGYFGTTMSGGANGRGTVFWVNHVGTAATVCDLSDAVGSYPTGGLVRGADGNLYGTATGGGANGFGGVYRLSSSFVPSLFTAFTGVTGTARGKNAGATLVADSQGNFFGVTPLGGANDQGTLFKIDNTGTLSTLAEFSDPPSHPVAGLAVDVGGNLVGMSNLGGPLGFGVVYKLAADGTCTTLVNFAHSATAMPGSYPTCSLTSDGNGGFYGTTPRGGEKVIGTVFHLTASGTYKLVLSIFGHHGNAAWGRVPAAPVASDGIGKYYGTTRWGGASELGTIFRFSSAADFVTNVEFTGTTGAYKGAEPLGTVTPDGAGNVYGLTSAGGTPNLGTVYKLASDGTFTTLAEFTGTGGLVPGHGPSGTLVRDAAGNFYGVTTTGGTADLGTIFKMTPAGGMTWVVSFTGTTGAVKGSRPLAGLVGDASGNFYGTTSTGGAGDLGTLYTITSDGVFTALGDFTGVSGALPGANPGPSPLLRLSDGKLYGTTANGGAGDAGSVFQVDPNPQTIPLPVATTLPAGAVVPGSAVLAGTVNPAGQAATVSFEWGTSVQLGNETTAQALAAGTSDVAVSATIGNALNQAYYYRVKAVTAAGTQRGQVVSFNSPALSPLGGNNYALGAGVSWTLNASLAVGDLNVSGTLDTNGKLLIILGKLTIAPGATVSNATGVIYYLDRDGALPPGRLWLAGDAAHDAADLDGDGRGNLFEFALGTNPSVADGAGAVTVGRVNGHLQLTYSMPAGVEGVALVPEVADGLGGTWNSGGAFTDVLSDVTTGSTRTVTVRDLGTGDNRYLRLRAIRQ